MFRGLSVGRPLRRPNRNTNSAYVAQGLTGPTPRRWNGSTRDAQSWTDSKNSWSSIWKRYGPNGGKTICAELPRRPRLRRPCGMLRGTQQIDHGRTTHVQSVKT